MDRIRGATTIITGASGAIGSATALELARRGAALTLADLDDAALGPVAEQCRAAGAASVATIARDVTSPDDRRRLIDAAQPLDILVNIAGIGYAAPLADISERQIDATFAVNLQAPILLTKLALPGMLARRRGVIVQLCSLSGKLGMPYFQTYAASKGGLIFFTKSMQHELDGTGVHMAMVSPGLVSEGGMWAAMDQKVSRIIGEVPPSKVAAAVIRAIGGRREVLVTAGPIRPVIAAGEISPSLGAALLRRLGFVKLLKETAAKRNQGEDR